MKRVLITGAEGFAASHLIKRLEKGFRVTGTYYLKEPERIESLFLDITDVDAVKTAVSAIKPDIVFHMAAQASGGLSYSNPMLTHSVNFGGTLNLLESLRLYAKDCAVIIPTSSDIYGFPDHLPVDEKHPIKPLNPYAASKAAVHFLCESYAETYAMRIIEARSFNHIGTGQSENFFIPGVIGQIKRIAGKSGTLKVGNLNLERDISDVRDVVEAYMLLAEAESGVYNICSGRAYRLKDLVEEIVKLSGKSIDIGTDPEKFRAGEPPVLYGSNAKIKKAVGWSPKRNLMKTLEWIYESD